MLARARAAMEFMSCVWGGAGAGLVNVKLGGQEEAQGNCALTGEGGEGLAASGQRSQVLLTAPNRLLPRTACHPESLTANDGRGMLYSLFARRCSASLLISTMPSERSVRWERVSRVL